jgi:hypothetical protein
VKNYLILAMLLLSSVASASYVEPPYETTIGGTGSTSQTASKAVTTDSNGHIVSTSATTSTQIGYLQNLSAILPGVCGAGQYWADNGSGQLACATLPMGTAPGMILPVNLAGSNPLLMQPHTGQTILVGNLENANAQLVGADVPATIATGQSDTFTVLNATPAQFEIQLLTPSRFRYFYTATGSDTTATIAAAFVADIRADSVHSGISVSYTAGASTFTTSFVSGSYTATAVSANVSVANDTTSSSVTNPLFSGAGFIGTYTGADQTQANLINPANYTFSSAQPVGQLATVLGFGNVDGSAVYNYTGSGLWQAWEFGAGQIESPDASVLLDLSSAGTQVLTMNLDNRATGGAGALRVVKGSLDMGYSSGEGGSIGNVGVIGHGVVGAGASSINLTNDIMLDASSATALDWQNRFLVNDSNFTMADWRNGLLYSTSTSAVSVDWINMLLESGGFTSVDWANHTLNNGSGVAVLNFAESVASVPALQFVGSTSGTINLQAAATTTPWTMTMPAAVCAAGQYWADDGSGNYTCTSPSGGSFLPLAGGTMTGSIAMSSNSITGLSSLQFAGSTSGTFTEQAAATTASWTMTVPAGVCAAGQYWSDNGSGVYSCTSPTSAVPTIVNGGDTAYSIQAGDGHIRSGTTLTAARTYTNDACTSGNIGERHVVKNLATQTFDLTVAGNGSDMIDASANYVLNPGDSLTEICAAAGVWDIE